MYDPYFDDIPLRDIMPRSERGTSNSPLLLSSPGGLKVPNDFVFPQLSFIATNCDILGQYGQKNHVSRVLTESGGRTMLNKINRDSPMRVNW